MIKWEKQQHYKKLKQIRYFNIFNIINILIMLSDDAKSAVLLKVLSLTKVEVLNFSLLQFPAWLCLVHGQLAMSLRRAKMSVIYKFQCFCLFYIQKWSVLSKHYLLHHINPPLLSSPQRDSAKCQLLCLHSQFSPKC